jgi:hypothetical protein
VVWRRDFATILSRGSVRRVMSDVMLVMLHMCGVPVSTSIPLPSAYVQGSYFSS